MNFNATVLVPTERENQILKRITLPKKCETTESDQQFLNALILRHQPKTILEVGVAAGGASVLILNAIRGTRSHLYSVDLMKEYYRAGGGTERGLKTGFAVNDYPELRARWTLLTGRRVHEYIKAIGQVDFLFLDTMHICPGGVLDFISVLPFLSNNSIVVCHDTHLSYKTDRCYCTNVLMSAIKGDKILPSIKFNDGDNNFYNIGATVIEEPANLPLYEIFNLLSLPWQYEIPEADKQSLLLHIKKYYPAELFDFTKEIFSTVGKKICGCSF